ncbi:MAG: hypothetical protein ORN57_04165 [Alphaproteobacteria bacterium]|nr:hypothetical protein [Alphaproteobacteria bacterium]
MPNLLDNKYNSDKYGFCAKLCSYRTCLTVLATIVVIAILALIGFGIMRAVNHKQQMMTPAHRAEQTTSSGGYGYPCEMMTPAHRAEQTTSGGYGYPCGMMTPAHRAEQTTKWMTNRLLLDNDQKTKVQELIFNHQKQREKDRLAYEHDMQKILTPEQFVKWQEYRRNNRRRGFSF